MRSAIILTMLICLFNACNSNKEKTSNEEVNDTANKIDSITDAAILACDYWIDSSKAAKMIEGFQKGLGNTYSALTDSFWIEACIIADLDRLFSQSSTYDGVRFFSGSDAQGKASSLFMVLTAPQANPSSTKQHENKWGDNFPTCAATEVKINRSYSDFVVERNAFATKFRKQTNVDDVSTGSQKDLSAGIWVDACLIREFASIISQSGQHDGIKLYAAAYTDEVVPGNVGHIDPKQSTFVLVPTLGPKHLPDWRKLNKERARPPANHSQLCPQICE